MKTFFLKFIVIFIMYFFTASTNYSQLLTSDTSWNSLINGKNLEGWSSFLGIHDKNQPYLINIDSNKVFQVVDGYLHLYKDHTENTVVQEGYIYTNEEYSNYRLRLEFMWGEKKFAQRKNKKKNSGIFFHI